MSLDVFGAETDPGFEPVCHSTTRPHTDRAPQVGWVSEPSYRGTLSILISCLTTLVLSTWSVMHLNVPEKYGTKTGYLKRYCIWGLVGMFGPELAIWAAWRQFLSAKALRDEIRHLQEEDKIPAAKGRPPWTLVHGYYAAMGGFVIDLHNESLRGDSTFTDTASRLTLTPKGVRLLAQCGILPNITVEEIEDKSKTDELGKLVACLQAIWMIVQVCTRVVLKLPVTLLEVTTIGHVVCALVLYALWWYKPRWIQEPTKIEGESLRSLSAFMFMASEMSSTQSDRSWLKKKFDIRGSEISNLYFKEDPCPKKGSVATITSVSSIEKTASHEPYPPSTSHDGFVARSATIQMDHTDDIESAALWSSLTHNSTTTTRHSLATEAISTYPAIRQLLHPERSPKERRYYDAIKMYPEMPQAFRTFRQRHAGTAPNTPRPSTESYLECDTEHLVAFAASDWPTDGLLRSMDRIAHHSASATATSSGLVISAFLWLASIAFAAVHLAAWRDAFPSAFEAWTWRASAAFVAFSGLVWLLISVVSQFSKHAWWLWYDLLSGDAPRWWRWVLLAVCVLCGGGYVFSRVFLIVEAFVSLRMLPLASFAVPQWTVSVPHL